MPHPGSGAEQNTQKEQNRASLIALCQYIGGKALKQEQSLALILGASSVGKTTVAQALARGRRFIYLDSDDRLGSYEEIVARLTGASTSQAFAIATHTDLGDPRIDRSYVEKLREDGRLFIAQMLADEQTRAQNQRARTRHLYVDLDEMGIVLSTSHAMQHIRNNRQVNEPLADVSIEWSAANRLTPQQLGTFIGQHLLLEE